ncbi:macrophage mannose receptor 1-like [Physella acuta]|uniref:macrophage mannose receptor 1-like n=1 Tax=Physella acuta TaxID=109671 RepID=UPI0027DE9DAB|nr:macrophage mannose receptor 1-like [Physella acuta]
MELDFMKIVASVLLLLSITSAQDCGTGWTVRPGTTLCYRLETAKVTWDQANTACNAFGGGLTTIADQDEKAFVSAFSDTANDYLWIGMTDSAGQGIWNWQNSPCVSLIDWNVGEPSYGNGGKECAIFLMKVSNYTWDDVRCGATFPYVCRKDIGPASETNTECNNGCTNTAGCTGYTYKGGQCTLHVRKNVGTIQGVATTVITCEKYPPPAPTTVATTTISTTPDCGTGWTLRPGTTLCYRLETAKVTWDQANTACNALGGGLTTIADQAEKAFVSAFSDRANDYLWIGMTDSAGQGIWNWQNSPCVSLIDWNVGEPSYGNGGKECAIFLMKVSNYTWDDVRCGATFPYVCRKDIGPASETNTECNNGCTNTAGCTGYTYKGGQCTLHVRKDVGTIQGVATTVITCEKYPPPAPTTVATTTISTTPDCGTGWTLRPGTTLCYRLETAKVTWDKANTACNALGGGLTTIADQAEKTFVSAFSDRANDYLWIGMTDSAGQGIWNWQNSPCVSLIDWNVGEPSYGNGGKECAIFLMKVSNYTWDDVRCGATFPYVCRKDIGPASETNTECNNGCTNTAGCTGYTYKGGQCTLHVRKDVGTIQGVATTVITCEKYPPPAPTTVATTTISTTPDCGTGWTLRPGTTLCYRLETAKVTWDQANTACNALGGGLTTIADQAEKTFVSAFSDRANDYLWIGMTDSAGQGIWNWQNSPCVSLIDWNVGEPSYGNGGKECAIFLMKVSNYTWDDVRCGATFPYVCRKDIGPASETNTECNNGCTNTAGCTGYTYKGGQCILHVRKDVGAIKGVATTVITCEKYPPPPPISTTPDCGTGWALRPGTTLCYRLETTKVTWENANIACNSFGGGLTTIADQAEKDYVSAFSDRANDYLWIGMTDSAGQGIWNWQDAPCVSFIDWNRGEPSYGNGGKECAIFLMKVSNYTWDDVRCGATFPYVCRKDIGPGSETNAGCNHGCRHTPGCTGYTYKGGQCTLHVRKYIGTMNGVATTVVTCEKYPPPGPRRHRHKYYDSDCEDNARFEFSHPSPLFSRFAAKGRKVKSDQADSMFLWLV